MYCSGEVGAASPKLAWLAVAKSRVAVRLVSNSRKRDLRPNLGHASWPILTLPQTKGAIIAIICLDNMSLSRFNLVASMSGLAKASL